MNHMINLVKSFDSYSKPPDASFEDGSIAYNSYGEFAPRCHDKALGDSVAKIKSKLAVQTHKKISRFARSYEGGQE